MKRPSAAPVLGIGLTATVAAVAMFPAASGAATRPVELAPRQTVNTIGTGPTAVEIADMNGDGRPDIVTANALGNSVSVLTQNASGTGWTSTVVGSTGVDPEGVAVGDLNGDGRPDIATADFGSDTVTVLTKDATGTGYTKTTAGSTGDAPHDLALADFNVDGRLDIATADSGSDTVTLLTKDVGGGTGYAATTAGSVGDRPLGIVAGDLNGDGLPDIATADTDGASATVLRNTGSGFASAPVAITGTGPFDIARADLDGDGLPELVTSNASAATASILRREPTLGGWTSTLVGGAGNNARSVAVGDLNLDGLPDLVFGNRSTNGLSLSDGVSIVLKDADATGYRAPGGVLETGDRPSDLAIGDLDGDGRPDLVTADTGDDTVSIFRNTTTVPAPPTTTTPTTTPDVPTPAAPAPAPAAPGSPAPPAKPVAKAPTLKLGTPKVTNGGRIIRIPATVSGAGVLSAAATHAAPRTSAGRRAKDDAERLTYAGLAGRKVAKGGTYSLVLRRTAAGRDARFAQRRITLSVLVTSTAADGRVVKQRRTVRVPTGR